MIDPDHPKVEGAGGACLGDFADIIMGQSPSGDTVSPDHGRALLNGPTEFGAHHPTPVQFTTDARRCALPGDLLFCVRGSTTGRMNWADQEYAIGRGVAAIRHRQESALQPFVRGVIELELPELLAQATGSTFPNVSAYQLAAIPFPTLGKAEQRAIANILGTLDDKIELNRRMNQTLEEMARALFKSWFVDFDPVRAKATLKHHATPPQGGSDWSVERARAYLDWMDPDIAALFPDRFVDSELGPIPAGWEVKALGDFVVNFDSKRIPVSKARRVNRPGIFPYYGAAGLMDYIDGCIFDGIYLLIGEDGSVVKSNDLAVTQYVWGRLWVNNHAHVLQGRGCVSTEQLYLYFNFEPVGPYVTGAVQPKLSQGRMNTMPFVFAGDDVCRAFATAVDPWFAKLRSLADASKILGALRDTMLPKLLLGEIRIKDIAPFGRVAQLAR